MTGYSFGVIGFTVVFLLFCSVAGPLIGRCIDDAIARRAERGEQEIADPVLAAHRGHTTRFTRRAPDYTVPRQLTRGG